MTFFFILRKWTKHVIVFVTRILSISLIRKYEKIEISKMEAEARCLEKEGMCTTYFLYRDFRG